VGLTQSAYFRNDVTEVLARFVRYTRQYGKTVQDAYFLCKTLDEAKAKFQELLDVLVHHDGVYIGSKEQRKRKNQSL
jgi:hypothetical protein